MSKPKSRQEFQFPTIKDRPDLDYVPAKSRDKEMIAMVAGMPRGYRTNLQQRIATEAASASVDTLVETDELETLRSLSDVLAVVALGSSYHLFGEPESDELAYRRIKITKLMDPESQRRTTTPELVDLVQQGFADAAQQAAAIEQRTGERRNVKRDNDKLGRQLATVGFRAAALHDGLDMLQGNEVDLQYASWLSARAAANRAMSYSESTGTRLTLSGLADPHSATMRFIHDNPWFVPVHAYDVLSEQLDIATLAATERHKRSEMLFN